MFKIIIVASTIEELASKVHGIAAQFQTTAVSYQLPLEPVACTAPGPDADEDLDTEPVETATINPPPAFPAAPVAQFPVAIPSPENSSPKLNRPEGNTDARGIPYDKRIHATTRATNKDGSWRYRKGVDDAYIAQVEAELRGVTPAAVAPLTLAQPVQAPVIAPPVFQQPPPAQPVAVVPQQVHAPVQAAPQYQDPIAPPASATKPAHTLETFKEKFIETMSQLMQSGKIDQKYVDSLLQYFGITELWKVKNNPDHAAQLFESLVAGGLITKVG